MNVWVERSRRRWTDDGAISLPGWSRLHRHMKPSLTPSLGELHLPLQIYCTGYILVQQDPVHKEGGLTRAHWGQAGSHHPPISHENVSPVLL